MTVEATKKSTKGVTIVTYILALVFLIAGFFVPLYGLYDGVFEFTTGKMLFSYLPDALNRALGFNLLTGDWVTPFTEGATEMFGMTINIKAWALLVYAVVTVVGLFMLIPVFVGKKTKKTSAASAYVVETVAAVALGVYYISYLWTLATNGLTIKYNYNLTIPFGGVLLMLVIQTLTNKKSLGLAKVLLFLLSSLTLLMLYNVFALIPIYGKFVTEGIENLNLVAAFSSQAGYSHGIVGFYDLLHINEIIPQLGNLGGLYYQILLFCVMIAATLVIVNFIIDLFGLATGAKYNKAGGVATGKGSKVFGLLRYILEFCAVVAVIVMLLILKAKIGAYLYLILILSALPLIIAIIRLARVRSIKKKNKATAGVHFNDEVMTGEHSENVEVVSDVERAQAEENAPAEAAEEAPAEQPATTEEAPEEVYVLPPVAEEAAEEPAEEEAPAGDEQLALPAEELPAEQPVSEETHTIVYNVKHVYNGPTDEFMDTLTDAEKVEFAKIFIEKTKGSFNNVPDYEIGGDNSEFFPMIFVYLNKFRALLSSQLLAKIYKHLSK